MAENTNTEREASAILSKICDLFQIGKQARTESTILMNVENVIRFARLLHAVERDLFPQPELPEDDDPYATVDDGLPAPNSWSAKDEADYVAQFRAALAARASLSLPAAGQEPVARSAAERDELLQAAIDFIRTLTGMEPPPIEVAPPEVFAPFREFVDKVQAITNRYSVPQPAVPVERPCHVFTVRKIGALTEWEPTTMAFALPDGEHALYTITQPAVAAGWVSVDERLPEPNVEVLCAGRGFGNAFVTACYYDDERREWYPINTHWTDATGCAQYPTHWQALPLPPAPSTEGESR